MLWTIYMINFLFPEIGRLRLKIFRFNYFPAGGWGIMLL